MADTATRSPAQESAPLSAQTLADAYRLFAELLLNPEQRDADRANRADTVLAAVPEAVAEPLRQFLASKSANDVEEYTALMELSPPVPLYLGAYLHDEPTSCRGAGVSGRNGYMLELGAVYSHYGLGIGSGELADYLPAVADFLALSLERRERDRIGLRRRLVEHQVLPALPKLRAELEKFESGYQYLIAAFEALVDEDIVANFDDPMWVPPEPADRHQARAPVEA